MTARHSQQLHWQCDDGAVIVLEKVRDRRARRLKLSINAQRVRLTVPAALSDSAALSFLHANQHWLQQQLAALPAPAPPLLPQHTQYLPLRGQQLPVQWHAGRSRQLHLHENTLQFRALDSDFDAEQPSPGLHRALHDFYQAQARRDIGRWLPLYLPTLPSSPSRIHFKQLQSRWGSLSARGHLSLDIALILAPPATFEYVLVHELCHLIEMNHSPAFWQQVALRFPNWQAEDTYLKQHGQTIKAQLLHLLRCH